ncbi:MAG: hypothetical protein ACRECY_09020 [Phyllobacterium sp.]
MAIYEQQGYEDEIACETKYAKSYFLEWATDGRKVMAAARAIHLREAQPGPASEHSGTMT